MRRSLHIIAGALALAVLVARSAGADPQEAADEDILRNCHLGVEAEDLVAFLRRQTLSPGEQRRVRLLLKQLGDPSYTVRERATRQLKVAGPAALALVQAAARDQDAERARRAQFCARFLEMKMSATCLEATLRLIKARNLVAARTSLREFLPCAADPGVLDEARSALQTLDGTAGADPSPTRKARRAAAQFLGAFSQGDWTGLRQIAGVPFALGGNVFLDTRADFDELFRPALLERKQPNKVMIFSFSYVVRGADYPAEGSEKDFLAAYPRNEIRAVYSRARIDAGQEECGAVFVHMTPTGPTVIGIGAQGSSK